MLSAAFGESIISKTQVEFRYNRFKEGRKDVNNDACRLFKSTTDENIETIKEVILDNR